MKTEEELIWESYENSMNDDFDKINADKLLMLKKHYDKIPDYDSEFSSHKGAYGEWENYMKHSIASAKELNSQFNNKVPIFHMVDINNRFDKDAHIEELFEFLNKRDNTEISVSVKKGIWNPSNDHIDNFIILFGYGKLLQYYDSDVYTTKDTKLFQRMNKSGDEYDYDEAIVRLGDIIWDEIFIRHSNITEYEINKYYNIDINIDDDTTISGIKQFQKSLF